MDQKRPVIALRPGHRANKPSKPSAPRKIPTIVGPKPPLLPENGNPYAAAEKAEELCKELIRLCRKNSPGPAAAPKAVGWVGMTGFRWRHFCGEVILWVVRWYCRFGVSYRDLEEMLHERGVRVDHTTLYGWVQRYAPEPEKWLARYRSRLSFSWRVDETCVKVKGRWRYLYRAIDKDGATLDFFLPERRSAKATKRFLGAALRRSRLWIRG